MRTNRVGAYGRGIADVKVAIMQPYFFPYIGYWQLIHAADTFVLFDDVQYIRHGWINRNRILNPQGGWQYVMAPLETHTHTELIKNITVKPIQTWRDKLLDQLNHYKRRAPYFFEIRELAASVLTDSDDRQISRVNLTILKGICSAIGLERNFLISSECNFDYRKVTDAGEWALQISKQLGATEYINPVSGAELFTASKFAADQIRLRFLKPHDIIYPRRGDFEPSLSIIDVLMFNGIAGTRNLINNYALLAP